MTKTLQQIPHILFPMCSIAWPNQVDSWVIASNANEKKQRQQKQQQETNIWNKQKKLDKKSYYNY